MKRLVFCTLIITLAVVGFDIATTGAQGCEQVYRIVVVTHGQTPSPFWTVVKNGVDAAGNDLACVETEYQAPAFFDMRAMSQLIDDAVASQPDGLIVSIPDPDVLGPSIRAAIEAGIPVISINSGSDVAAEMGVIAHVGQTEYEAGLGGGQQMAAAGVTNALCTNEEVGNAALDLRCQGLTDALAATGGTATVLPFRTPQAVATALEADPTINGILTLNAESAEEVRRFLQNASLLDQIQLATFDLSPAVLQDIADGEILFAIDQQPYTQGYLSVIYMYLYLSNLNTPGNIMVQTGPSFVTQATATRIIEYSARGTR